MWLPSFLALVLAVSAVAAREECSVSNIQSCSKELDQVIDKDMKQPVFPYYTDAKLNKLCGILDTRVLPCLQDLEDTCEPVPRAMLEGITSALHFLCHSGKQEYLTVRGCLASRSVAGPAKKCNDTLAATIKVLNHEIPEIDRKDAMIRICSAADTYLTCLYDVVKEKCGPEAAKWQRTLNRKALTPVLAFADCNVLQHWAIAAIIGALCFVIVMILYACRVVYRRRRRKDLPLVVNAEPMAKADMAEPGPSPYSKSAWPKVTMITTTGTPYSKSDWPKATMVATT